MKPKSEEHPAPEQIGVTREMIDAGREAFLNYATPDAPDSVEVDKAFAAAYRAMVREARLRRIT